MKNLMIPHILHTLDNFLIFLDLDFSEIISPPPKCNEPFLTISKPYEVPKNFKNFKILENWEGTKNVRIPHTLRTLVNFFVFLNLDFSGNHFSTS